MKIWGSNVFLQHISLSTCFFPESSLCCTPLRGFSVVKFHHSGCFPLHCPLDLKMDCPFISFHARAVGVRRVTAFSPHLSLGFTKPLPSPAGVRSARPRGSSIKERLQCPLWPCNLLWCSFPSELLPLSYEIHRFKKLFDIILKAIMHFTIMHLQTLLSLLQNWHKIFFH